MTEKDHARNEIAGVLAEHQITHHGTTFAFGFTPCRCSCGFDYACPIFQSWGFCDHYHRAHLADALADLLAARDRRVRAEAVRDLAAETLRMPADPAKVAQWLRDHADRIEAEG